MPEIPNRDDIEANFIKKFGKVARRHMFEFREHLGDPPDINRVPQAFWDQMEREREDDIYPFLLFVFRTAAELFGWDSVDAGLAAFGFASNRAKLLAQQWTTSTRRHMSDVERQIEDATRVDRFRETEGHEPGSVTTVGRLGRRTSARSIRPRQPDESEDEFRKDRWREAVDQWFGPENIARHVEDMFTEARHEGSEAGVNATVGKSEEDTWKNTGSNVCDICSELDNKPRTYWARRFPHGPPSPHPNCKCLIEYANVPSP